MPRPVPTSTATGVAARLSSFVVERFPFALAIVKEALESSAASKIAERDGAHIEFFRLEFRRELKRALEGTAAADLPDPTPGVSAGQRIEAARSELVAACDAFLVREALAASLTAEERREILRGMVLTRAVDNRLKQFFVSGEVKYGNAPFQGKGFRSLGQEAIYAAGIRLRRGAKYRDPERGWQGDVVGPIIRDLGAALAMRPDRATVRMVLNAQMGKQGAADGRQGPAHRRLRVGHPSGDGAAVDQHAVGGGHGDGVCARAIGPRRGVVHRRRRLVARRMA